MRNQSEICWSTPNIASHRLLDHRPAISSDVVEAGTGRSSFINARLLENRVRQPETRLHEPPDNHLTVIGTPIALPRGYQEWSACSRLFLVPLVGHVAVPRQTACFNRGWYAYWANYAYSCSCSLLTSLQGGAACRRIVGFGMRTGAPLGADRYFHHIHKDQTNGAFVEVLGHNIAGLKEYVDILCA